MAIYERNRDYAQVCLRRILYGNTPESLDPGKRVGPTRAATDHRSPTETLTRHYVFEVLFDYGDLPAEPAIPYDWPREAEAYAGDHWPLRPDPFSTFRAGFELRSLRRCERVLMLHHFDEGELAGAPLVRSTDFTYEVDQSTRLSFLSEVTVMGYRRVGDAYTAADMPPVSFSYSSFEPQRQRYRSLSARGGDLPPASLGNADVALVDLYGDGLPDVLNTSPRGYFYWRNLGEGGIDRRREQAAPPAAALLGDPGVALGDLGGDALADLIVRTPQQNRFYEATPDGGWRAGRPFARDLSLDFSDPNLRLLDLTGDGLSDVLITRDDHFLWYRCLGEEGYDEPRMIPHGQDLDGFPWSTSATRGYAWPT